MILQISQDENTLYHSQAGDLHAPEMQGSQEI